MFSVTPEAIAAARYVAALDAVTGLLAHALDFDPGIVSVRVIVELIGGEPLPRVSGEFLDHGGRVVGGFEL